MISSVGSGISHNYMAFTKMNTQLNSKAAEEANESVSEKMAEARNQNKPNANYNFRAAQSNAISGSSALAGNIIDVHI